MKKRCAFVLSALLTAILLVGCGMEQTISVDDNLTVTIADDYYFDEEEAKELGEDTDLSGLKKVDRNGKTYYLSQESRSMTHEQFEKQVGRLDEKCIVIYNPIVTEIPVIDTREEEDPDELDKIEFYDLSIELPFVVAASNMFIKEGSTIFCGIDNSLKDDNVIFAVSDAGLLEGTDLTISGASEGGIYNEKKTISINTIDGVIKSMGVTVNGTEQEFSDEEHPYNVTVCSEDGIYTVSAELFSGIKQTLTFTVDRTKPKTNVKNNKTYKSGKKITFSDKTSGIKSAKLDGKAVKNGKAVKKKGSHKLVLTDRAGNKKTVKFRIR